MNAREVALTVLYACHRQGAWADGALKRELARARLDSRDAALASRLVYGALQDQLLLDYYLAPLCPRGLDSLEPKVRDILRLGAYQLLRMDKIPAMAAVNESVELAKRHAKSPRAAGFVNAVLRNLDRGRDRLPPLPGDPVERLSVQYSHPRWLVEAFSAQVGEGEIEALLAADNAPAPITAQVNTLKITAQDLARRLAEEGAETRPHPLPDCLILADTGDLERLPAFQEGLFYIQDPAARMAVLAARPRAGERVLDLCAAPGGKTFAAAIAMGDRGHILSRDLYPRKAAALAAGAKRLGLSCVETAAADATGPIPGPFDLVIADVPCSGLGVIRKKPDIRYKDPRTFRDLPPLQAAILENAAGAVAPGGRLLYATCTLRRAENQGQVEKFLAAHGDFALAGQETFWPHRQGTDGFYYALLERR